MPVDDKQLAAFENTTGKLLERAAGLGNLSLGSSAVLGFAAESIFRFVRLGFAIRREREKANAQLDQRVRLQDIPREDIHVDLNDFTTHTEARTGAFQARFPEVSKQFWREIRECKRESLPSRVRARTMRTLSLARRHLPNLLEQGRFENPELQELFGKWLDPAAPDYQRIFSEMADLFPTDTFLESEHEDRTLSYFRRSLENFGLRLDLLTQQEQQLLEKTVRDLVWNAILGGGGAVDRTSAFLVNLKKISLDERLSSLQAEKTRLNPEKDAARIAELDREIGNLTAWKKRLA